MISIQQILFLKRHNFWTGSKIWTGKKLFGPVEGQGIRWVPILDDFETSKLENLVAKPVGIELVIQ